MEKIILPGAWDFGIAQAAMLKTSSRGLRGSDLDDFVKRSSDSLAYRLRDFVPPADTVPMHLIAIGATERYGANRNGDGFKEATCRKHHDTFTKFGRYNRHHQNKNPAESYGTIKYSWYNEPMSRIELLVLLNAEKSAADRNGGLVADREVEKLARDEDVPVSMACFLDPDYPILTKAGGYVPIAEIRTGDMVWTKEGRWRRVTQLNRRLYSGSAYEVRVNGLPLPLRLTADHPMWAKCFSGSREVTAVKAKTRRWFTDTAAFESQPAGWTRAEDLAIGDRLFYRPITRYSEFGAIACQDLAVLLGYYTAEGSFNYNGERACTTAFHCNMADSAPRRIPEIMSRLFPNVVVTIRPHQVSEVGLVVEISNTDFSEFLRKYVGVGCKRKLVPPEILNAQDDVRLAFLGAWLDGDGWLDKKGAHWSTASVNLALQLRDLLVLTGIPASIYKIDHAKCPTSGYRNSGIEYTINISHLDTWRLAEYSEKAAHYPTPKLQRKKPAAMRRCLDGTYALRIAEMRRYEVTDQMTYNFEVEEDESYSAAGLVSHNCRVAHDVCSSCHHKSATRKEYCTEETCIAPTGEKRGGVKHNMTKVCADGHVLHVDNPNPQFFDISGVFRGADRIAFGSKADYLMQKAASGEVVSGAELAELWDIHAPFSSTIVEAKRALVEKLASCEHSTEHPLQLLTMAFQNRPPFDIGPLQGTKQAAALQALAECSAMLPLDAYLRLQKKAVDAAAVAACLPGVFTHLAADPQLESRLEAACCRDATPSESLRQWAYKQAEYYGVQPAQVIARAKLAALRGAQHSTHVREKSASAAADVWAAAEQYALYQVVFLHKIAAQNSELPLTLRAVVLQNNCI